MTEKQNVDIIENSSHLGESQLLGFLPPGAGVLLIRPSQNNLSSAPQVMAVPIAALFVQHKPRAKTITAQSA